MSSREEDEKDSAVPAISSLRDLKYDPDASSATLHIKEVMDDAYSNLLMQESKSWRERRAFGLLQKYRPVLEDMLPDRKSVV